MHPSAQLTLPRSRAISLLGNSGTRIHSQTSISRLPRASQANNPGSDTPAISRAALIRALATMNKAFRMLLAAMMRAAAGRWSASVGWQMASVGWRR